MYELLLITVITSIGGGSVSESQAVESYTTSAECLDNSTRFMPRRMQLPTGQTLNIHLACQKR